MHVHATVMHDCMQLKVKIIVFHAQSIDLQRFYYRNKLSFQVLRLVWHTLIDRDDRLRSFNTIANYAGCANLTLTHPVSTSLNMRLTARVKKQVFCMRLTVDMCLIIM